MHLKRVFSLRRPLVNALALLLTGVITVLSEGERLDCNSSHVPVPIPNLEYMLNEELHVTWYHSTAVAHMTNYSAHYCCKKPPTYYKTECPHVCPNSTTLHYCSKTVLSLFEVENKCKFIPNQYIRYTIFLIDTYRDCSFKGSTVQIQPELKLAHASGIQYLNMTSKKNGNVQLTWPEPASQSHYFTFCYFVTCEYLDAKNKTKKLKLNYIKNESAVVSLTDHNKIFTTYTCCVKVQACRMRYAPFSKEICNRSKLPVTDAVSSGMLSNYHATIAVFIYILVFT